MMSYATHVTKRITPQSQQIPGTGTAQVKNSAGGFAWKVDCWTRLDRFLVLGSEKGSYYATEKAMTIENADCILECAKQDAGRAIRRIAEISNQGRAPKNDPAIFALALIAGEKGTAGKMALDAIPQVCRIGTHLFQFVETLNGRRGWGRSVRDGIANWYTSKSPDALSRQVTKYQQRNNWSHRDVLRKCHAKSDTLNPIFKYAAQREKFLAENMATLEGLPLLMAVENAKHATLDSEIVRLIQEHDLPRECIPTQFLNSVAVWEALLQEMPPTAMIRNLGKMSSIGLLTPMSKAASHVRERLNDVGRLRKARVHPVSILLALSTYKQGRGDKGSLTWTPVSQIIDALDEAFYSAFKAVEPTNKRHLLALDVSGSMGGSVIAGTSISCREASAAMAMVMIHTEPNYHCVGFSEGGRRTMHSGYGVDLKELSLSKRMRLDGAVAAISNIPFGGTDCALPMVYAKERKLPVDVFVVYTDSETWAGNIHPSQALVEYRNAIGIGAKLIVVGMVSNGFNIADPNDAGMMDVTGFDTTVPQIMAEFVGW